MAASVTTATGSTTLLMNRRLEISTSAMQMTPTARMTPITSTICWSTSRSEDTSRMTPATRPLKSSGADTAITFSPVTGSRPRKGVIS